MVTEDYVSFEVAKLLKEKGFDEGCRSYFINDLGDYRRCAVEITNKDCTIEQILRPTHQKAMKWLREVHNVVIVIEPHTYNYINEKNSSYVFAIWEGDNYTEIYSYKDSGLRGISYPTYEEAVEASLKYYLENLI